MLRETRISPPRVAAAAPKPAGSKPDPLRERLGRATAPVSSVQRQAPSRRPVQRTAPAVVPLAAAAQEPVVPTTSQPLEACAEPGAAVASAAAGSSRSTTARTGLRHLPDAVVGKLAEFIAGRTEPGTISETTTAENSSKTGQGEIRAAIEASRDAFVAAGMFSLIINVLMLAGPLFMLQVYDRVMTSGSLPTLVVLTLIVVALYAIIGVFEVIRTRIIVRAGVEIDQRINGRIFRASLKRTVTRPGSSTSALRELDHVRQFVSGPGPLTFFDAPWTPVYLIVVAMLHWALGLTALIGAGLLILVAWASERVARDAIQEAGKTSAQSVDFAESGQRNAQTLISMGMVEAYRARWQQINAKALAWQILAADQLGTSSAISKTLRLLLQSLMLAVGAALAIAGEISAGAIVAATITFGRAMAPVEQALGHWRSFVKARESYGKLEKLLAEVPEQAQRTELPEPKGLLEVQALRVATPETNRVILANISFAVRPGQVLAVIGPSASGKSTLARALVGLWPPFGGAIKIDGARLDQWDHDVLGRHIGYLPQNAGLFAGTVRENIARFRSDATDAQVVEAARQAHAHDLILGLPNGYDTELGAFGAYLSAGQRQRIGLARALYGNPALVVLDEPNANLDRDGDDALAAALEGLRKRGRSVVLISHRVQAIGKADLLLYLDRGVQRAFGPRQEVMKLFQGGAQPSNAPAAAAAREGE